MHGRRLLLVILTGVCAGCAGSPAAPGQSSTAGSPSALAACTPATVAARKPHESKLLPITSTWDVDLGATADGGAWSAVVSWPAADGDVAVSIWAKTAGGVSPISASMTAQDSGDRAVRAFCWSSAAGEAYGLTARASGLRALHTTVLVDATVP
jgi:hypothetical protein